MPEIENKKMDEREIVTALTDHFITEDPETLQEITMNGASRSLLDERATQWMIRQGYPAKASRTALTRYKLRIFGYGELEELINDPDISDIAIYGVGNVWVKKFNKNMMSDIAFDTADEVNRYINAVAMRLKVNISAIEAKCTKTDRTTNSDFILRISIVSQKLTSSGCHNMHIRKIAKEKVDLDVLESRGMLDERLKDYLVNAAKTSSGLLICGRGAAGKTTLMNALIDEIPQESSAAIIQENEELFTKTHLATYAWHVDIGAGESRVSYTLEDLARQGLLMNIDYFIIGEVKGAEARYIVTAANTGTTCWCTIHGNNSQEALGKLADYIKSHPDYSSADIKDIVPFLVALRTIVFVKNYKVMEISEVTGVDRIHGILQYRKVYDRTAAEPWNPEMK